MSVIQKKKKEKQSYRKWKDKEKNRMYREKCGDNMKKKKDPSFMEGSRITGKNNNDEKKKKYDRS